MSGISNAKKNLNISSIKEYPKLRQKLARLAYNCLEELQVIRKELTMAYIVSGKVVTEEDDKYEFRNEKEVRIDNKQGQDIDKKQREEEQILKDLKILCSIKNNIADNSARGNQEEKGNIKEKVRNNFLGKILRLLKKLIQVVPFYKGNKKLNMEEQAADKLNPVESMEQSINILKEYQETLGMRMDKLKGLKDLQVEVERYKLRIVKDPKEYNKNNYMSRVKENAKMLNKSDFGRG